MKKFNMSYFKQQVNYGRVFFEILMAKEKQINTTNGLVPVLSLDVRLVDPKTNKSDTLRDHLIFINDNPKLEFAQFMHEYTTKINSEGFDLGAELIGISGEVDYYQNNKKYDSLARWDFNIPPKTAQNQMMNHVMNNAHLGNQQQSFQSNQTQPINSSLDDFLSSVHTDADIAENVESEDNWTPFPPQIPGGNGSHE